MYHEQQPIDSQSPSRVPHVGKSSYFEVVGVVGGCWEFEKPEGARMRGEPVNGKAVAPRSWPDGGNLHSREAQSRGRLCMGGPMNGPIPLPGCRSDNIRRHTMGLAQRRGSVRPSMHGDEAAGDSTPSPKSAPSFESRCRSPPSTELRKLWERRRADQPGINLVVYWKSPVP